MTNNTHQENAITAWMFSLSRMLLAIEIGSGGDQDGDIFAGAADHGVAQVTQELADCARLVVVVYDELRFGCAADGALAALPLVYCRVVFEGDAVFCFEVYAPDTLRIFARILTAFLQAALLAYWLDTIHASSVFVELRQRFVGSALGTNSAFRCGIPRMIALLCFAALFADSSKASDATLGNGIKLALGLLGSAFSACAKQCRPSAYEDAVGQTQTK